MFAKADPKPHWGQTYVVKAQAEAEQRMQIAAFKQFAEAEGVLGAGAYATVELPGEAYLVITLGKAGNDVSGVRYIKECLLQMPGHVAVE